MFEYEENLPEKIQKIYNNCSKEEQEYLIRILEELAETGTSKTYEDIWLQDYKEIPVDKTTFLCDPYYLGSTNSNGTSIYPAWMETMQELERTGNQYFEIVFTGATRTGKTSTAVSDAAYNLYKLMCLRDPQKYFSLKAVTSISVFFFNLNESLAKGVAFKEFNNTLKFSPWFNAHGHFTRSENPVYVPEGGLIEVAYGSDASHALGKATYIVVFDEVNFTGANIKDIVKAKKKMKAKYDTLVARVTGTFVKNGEVFGKIYVISSKNSDSDFMEEYIESQRLAGNQHMYIFDKPQWEVWPPSKYSSDRKFFIALGGKSLKSFVVPDNETEEGFEELRQQGYKLLQVPEDNKVRFLSDFDIALRDIAGISVPGTLSFITQASIDVCINKSRRNPFYNDIVQIGTKDGQSLEQFCHIEHIMEYKRYPMFIHLDLSLTTDRTGISAVCISGRKDMTGDDGKTISQPMFTHLFSVALEAPRGDKIPYNKILEFICWLRRQGFNISKISRDQYQSEYLAQLLEAQNFDVDKISLDRTPDGYIALRSIIIEERIDMLDQHQLQDELIHLQRDSVTGKVDHPTGGYKDTADSLAGAVYEAILVNPAVAVATKSVASAISKVNRAGYYSGSGPSDLGSAFAALYKNNPNNGKR